MKPKFYEDIAGRLQNRLKKEILRMAVLGDKSISEMSKNLDVSIPTVTKTVVELVKDEFMKDLGKQGTSGGRRPSIYGLNGEAGYIVGVDVMRDQFNVVVTSFRGEMKASYECKGFDLEGTEASAKAFCTMLRDSVTEHGFDFDSVLAYGIDLTGRVNPVAGMSYSYNIGAKPIAKVFEAELGVPCFIENDSRAMTYGEYICGGLSKTVKDLLFINVGWGLGMGMVLDGKLYYGKSGYSGEIGHFPFLDNNKICQCGKIGCLETGCSGRAILNEVIEALKAGRASKLSAKFKSGKPLTFNDLIEAIKAEDMVVIEKVEQGGNILGRAIAGLINIFNPELVVIGGRLSVARNYIMDPIRGGVKKYALNTITKDTKINYSTMLDNAGPMGAAMVARSRLLGFM
jgi:predicted NBD/HSP70 family sugar kinase